MSEATREPYGRQDDAPPVVGLSRRRFLAGTGLLAAAAAAVQVPGMSGLVRAQAQSADDLLGPLLADIARPLVQQVAADTVAGVVAFVVPGDDPYSQHQGVTAELGGIPSRGHEFLLEALDEFMPVPDTYLQPIAASLAAGMSDTPIPAELVALPDEVTATVDQGLLALFANDQTVPVSAVVALLVNQAAMMAHPDAIAGPFVSPFANLSYEQKFDAWKVIELDTAGLIATFDTQTPEPLRASLSGLVKFVAGALVEFAAFGSYSEWGFFDREAGRATQRPVGWEMSNYLPGRLAPVDGQPELMGYYGGVRRVQGSWDQAPLPEQLERDARA